MSHGQTPVTQTYITNLKDIFVKTGTSNLAACPASKKQILIYSLAAPHV